MDWYPVFTLDIEVYSKESKWAQGRYLVHGYDDVYWTDDINMALDALRTELEHGIKKEEIDKVVI